MSLKKLVSLDEAVAEIADGSKLGLGGWIFNGQPMALVRALIRRGVRDLDLIPTPGSIAPDMLIGAGCARSTVCVFISFEQFGLAPHFRRQAEAGTLKVIDMDGPGIAGGMRAAICDLPWMPVPDLGTDLPKHAPEQYWELPTKPGERKLLAVPAVRPDVTLLHAQQADEFGNIQYIGSPFFDAMLAQASRKVIVSVDRIVSNEEIRRNNHLTKIPGALIDMVVEAPHGAHPTSSPSFYRPDNAHLKDYVDASKDVKTWEDYLQRYVKGASQAGYVNEIGSERLTAIKYPGSAWN